jgi:hypothetical protein
MHSKDSVDRFTEHVRHTVSRLKNTDSASCLCPLPLLVPNLTVETEVTSQEDESGIALNASANAPAAFLKPNEEKMCQ